MLAVAPAVVMAVAVRSHGVLLVAIVVMAAAKTRISVVVAVATAAATAAALRRWVVGGSSRTSNVVNTGYRDHYCYYVSSCRQ